MALWATLTATKDSKPILVNLDRAIMIVESTNPAGTRISFERGENPQAVTVTETFEEVRRFAESTPRA